MTKKIIGLLTCFLLLPAFAIEATDDFSVVNLPKSTLLTFTKAQTLVRMQIQSHRPPSLDNFFNLNSEISSILDFVLSAAGQESKEHIQKLFSKQIKTTDRTYFAGVTDRVIDNPRGVKVECFLLASTAKTDVDQVGVDINRSLLLTKGAQTSTDRASDAIGFTVVELTFSDEPRNFFENLICQLHFAKQNPGAPSVSKRNTFSVLELKKLFPGLTVDLPEDSFR
jgi:hypothetical protein